MPYIPQSKRKYWSAQFLFDENDPDLTHPGTLNYLITKMCLLFERSSGGPSYSTYNSIIGALECAKLEFYRRKIERYEDLKCKENGEIYE